MEDQVMKICQACNFHLRNIGKMREHIDEDVTKLLVISFITSRLDYCNALLSGCPNHLIERLQKIQNRAARLITLTKRTEHITPVLQALHWLPVKYRIDYKILCYAFKCLHGSCPSYLQELVQMYQPSRNLRSSNSLLLREIPIKSNTSKKAFSCYAPTLWNSLSPETRSCSTFISFKTRLKTELFCRAFY